MVVYRKQHFIILDHADGFIVYNTCKVWEEGHTHLRSFKAAKTAINLVLKKKMPRSRGSYYLTSLQRISQDEDYISRIEGVKQSRKQKGKKMSYYNVNNGYR